MTKNIRSKIIMSLRGNNDLVDTDDSDEGLQTNLHNPKRSWLWHGNNLSRTLTNRHERNTVTLMRIADKVINESKLEKQKMHISVPRREKYMTDKKVKLRR